MGYMGVIDYMGNGYANVRKEFNSIIKFTTYTSNNSKYIEIYRSFFKWFIEGHTMVDSRSIDCMPH